MAEGQLASILHLIRKLTGAPPACAITDGQLLDKFVAARDEEAFAALLARHGPMVLGLCRRVLRDTHEAEDAFQATFLILARKAAMVRRHQSLASWLCQVAYRVALAAKQRTGRQRELALQSRAGAPEETMADATGWEVREVLDEELNRLPQKYHAPVVLCYLEGKTCAEAADQLQWPAGTVKVRLMRARELLRSRLERRGLILSATALTAGLAPDALAASVPAALVDMTVKTAAAFAANRMAVHLAANTAVTLAEGVLKAMRVYRMKMAATLALLVALAGTGAGLCLQALGSEGPSPNPVVALAPIPAGEEPEERYQGKPAAHWINVVQHSEVVSCRIEAAQALGSIGAGRPAALAALERTLGNDSDDQVRSAAVTALRQIASTDAAAVPVLLKSWKDNGPVVRIALAEAASQLADKHEQTLPLLVESMKDKHTASRGVITLFQLGRKAAAAEPALREALRDRDARVQLAAAVVLSRAAQSKPPFDPMPLVRAALEEDRAWLLSMIYGCKGEDTETELFIELGSLEVAKGRGADGVRWLTRALADEKRPGNLRASAATALGGMGSNAKEALPALTRAMQDKDLVVRQAAAVAHWHIAGQPDKVVPDLVKGLQNADVRQQLETIQTLDRIGVKDKAAAAPALADAMKSKDKPVRLAAALAHWRVCREVAIVAPVLTDLLTDKEFLGDKQFPRKVVEKALWETEDVPLLLELLRRKKTDVDFQSHLSLEYKLTEQGGLAAAPELFQLLNHESAVVCKSAAQVLEHLRWDTKGDMAAASAPVEHALTHPNPTVRRWALYIWARQPERAKTVPALLRGLQDPAAEVRQAAVVRVEYVGPQAKDAIPELVRILDQEPRAECRMQAAGALWQLDPTAARLPGILLKLLHEHPDQMGSFLAVRGPSTLPILQMARSDRDAQTRLGGVLGLARLANTPAEMVAWDLNQALDDEDVRVRRAAADGLLRLQVKEPATILRQPGAVRGTRLPAERIEKALVSLKDGSGKLPPGMLATVTRFGEESAVPALRQALKDRTTRVQAALVLLTMTLDEPARSDMVAALRAALRDNDPMRLDAATALGKLGTAARDGVPELQAAMKDADPLLRIAAAGALWKVDRRQESAVVTVLCTALQLKPATPPPPSRLMQPASAGHDARTAAALVLQEVAPAGKEAIPLLIDALREEAVVIPSRVPRPPDPYHAALSGALRRYEKEAVSHLVKVMADDNPQVRQAAFAVLADIGPAAQAALPALRAAVLDREPTYRAAAQAALNKIDAKAAHESAP